MIYPTDQTDTALMLLAGTHGPKNAPQPRPANPAPITPPSRKAHPVVQSLQILALYAALVAVVFLLVTTCSTTTEHPAAALKQGGQP